MKLKTTFYTTWDDSPWKWLEILPAITAHTDIAGFQIYFSWLIFVFEVEIYNPEKRQNFWKKIEGED